MREFRFSYDFPGLTFVLSKRNHEHLGMIRNVADVHAQQNFMGISEVSFTVYKYDEHNQIEPLWDDITSMKFIWVKEFNAYYEISVDISDSYSPCKTVTMETSGEAELSQVYTHNLEINTEDDIARKDYKNPTIFYNPNSPSESLLHRVLSFAPHYSIGHVDESLAKIQRTFSSDGDDIYSFLTGTVAEEIGCMFIIDSFDRSISAYDIYTTCNACGERGDFEQVCPKCGSDNLKYFGNDTTFLIDVDNLADSIDYSIDTDSVKNCFRLEAGDDDMTAAVVNNNPNGSSYIYYFTDEMKRDMSEALVKKLDAYDALYASKMTEYGTITDEIYDAIDKIMYYTSSMMPTVEHAEVTSKTEAAKLTAANLSPLSISNVTSATSVATVNSALKNYAKVYVKTGFVRVDVETGTFTYKGTESWYGYGTWVGTLRVTNYSDSEDTTVTPSLTIKVDGNYETFLDQKIRKALLKDEDEDSIFDVLTIDDLTKFKQSIALYGLNSLTRFYDALQGAIDVMIEEDQANENADLYETFYVPYYNKLKAVQAEIDAREKTIEGWETKLENANKRRDAIKNQLNFRNYVGEELFKEFCCFRREDTYSNDNYISDGLENTELLKRAREFLDRASSELKRAATPKISISGTVANFLAIEEYRPFIENLQLGDFIRVRVDSTVYRVRLISYSVSFDDLTTVDLEFSNISRNMDSMTRMKELLDHAKDMASSYGYVEHQMEQNSEVTKEMGEMLREGLDLTNKKILSSPDTQDVVFDRNGILVRSYDDIGESWQPTQLKIINSTLAVTDDGWRTVRTAVGKFYYTDPANGQAKVGYGINSEVLVGNLFIGEKLFIRNADNSFVIDNNGFTINTTSKTQNRSLFKIQKDGKNVFWVDSEGDVQGNNLTIANLTATGANITGTIHATAGDFTGTITGSTITGSEFLSNTDSTSVRLSGGRMYVGYGSEAEVGFIGANAISMTTDYGLVFDLNYEGEYMGWGAKFVQDETYDSIIRFTRGRANSTGKDILMLGNSDRNVSVMVSGGVSLENEVFLPMDSSFSKWYRVTIKNGIVLPSASSVVSSESPFAVMESAPISASEPSSDEVQILYDRIAALEKRIEKLEKGGSE